MRNILLLKRVFDIISAIMGLIILFPLFLVISILIKLNSPGEIFFRQIRVGRWCTEFKIYKFRTMVVNAENLGPKITIGDDKRVTKIGGFLRKTKLDELPQLINVLTGDMSIVGPRPEVPEYVAIYPQQVKDIVLSVRPGITEWASIQVIDENHILAKSLDPKYTYANKILPQKLGYAVRYVKTRSFFGDLKIILVTLIRLINRQKI
jgi:lipopolysaccharide/colanic/teichoic acid biosynthesis glycosyltransferase